MVPLILFQFLLSLWEMDQHLGRLVCGRLLATDKFALQICEQRIASMGCCDELHWVVTGISGNFNLWSGSERFYRWTLKQVNWMVKEVLGIRPPHFPGGPMHRQRRYHHIQGLPSSFLSFLSSASRGFLPLTIWVENILSSKKYANQEYFIQKGLWDFLGFLSKCGMKSSFSCQSVYEYYNFFFFCGHVYPFGFHFKRNKDHIVTLLQLSGFLSFLGNVDMGDKNLYKTGEWTTAPDVKN